MRLRWKLIRWREQRRRRARQREQVVQHIKYAHKTCPGCGAVQDRDEAVCTGCGAKLGTRGFQVIERIGLALPVPLSVSTLLAIAILVAYARVWVAAGGGLGAPPVWLLVELGARWGPAMADEPWRLVTAMFLHGGLLHLLFNMLALATVGPRIEELYGRPTALGLFIATGVLANLATLQVAPLAISVGASGGVMGLIGAAAAWGHRAGTGHGRALRDAMLKWIAYTFVFGFFFNADHWAHLFGAIGGAAFGLLVKPEVWMRRALIAVRVGAGLVGLAATVGAVAIICARDPSPLPEEGDEDVYDPVAVATSYVEACIQLHAGDARGAVARVRQGIAFYHVEAAALIDERTLAETCARIEQTRRDCRTEEGRRRRALEPRENCETLLPILERLPAPPAATEPASAQDQPAGAQDRPAGAQGSAR
jgi:rhomboid protease GluP